MVNFGEVLTPKAHLLNTALLKIVRQDYNQHSEEKIKLRSKICTAARKDNSFLPRDAMRKRGLCSRPVALCLSVTFGYCIQTGENIGKLLFRPCDGSIRVGSDDLE